MRKFIGRLLVYACVGWIFYHIALYFVGNFLLRISGVKRMPLLQQNHLVTHAAIRKFTTCIHFHIKEMYIKEIL